MKSKLFGTAVAFFALLGASYAASAADMPVKAYRPVVAYYNWTGFYAGINAGYGLASSHWSAPAESMKPKGFLAGGTLGYNWQAGSLVYGIEGDFDWADVKGSTSCPGGRLAVLTCETKENWLATFRGRIGYAFDRWLPYITGGGAYGNVKASIDPGISSVSKSELGWTIGAGLEYAFLGNWTAKVEYLYVDLGSFNAGVAPAVNNVSFKENIVRAGLNYKFSGPIFSRF
jgi:outer membrane immunogenic protein